MVVPAMRTALSLTQALPYVAAAYLCVMAVIVVYVAIMALRQRRVREQVRELTEQARGCDPGRDAGANDHGRPGGAPRRAS